MYHVLDLTSLRTRARYDRGVQYSAVYRIGDAAYALCPSGALEPVAAERRAA